MPLFAIRSHNKAITHHRKALTLRSDGHPYCSESLKNLAIVLHVRHEKSRIVEDFEESFSLCELAVDDLAASSMYRLTSAIQ